MHCYVTKHIFKLWLHSIFYPLISKFFIKEHIYTHCLFFIAQMLCKALKNKIYNSFLYRLYLIMNCGVNLTKAGVKHWFLCKKHCISAISLKLQLALFCQGLTLLHKVSLPNKSMDSMIKYKLSQQLSLFPKSSVKVSCYLKRLCSCWTKPSFTFNK